MLADAPPVAFDDKPADEEEEEKKELGLLTLYETRLQMNLLMAAKLNSQSTKKE